MDALKGTQIVYVTRDIERASALADEPNYSIISNSSPFAKLVLPARPKWNVGGSEAEGTTEDRTQIVLIDEERMLDTWELLQHEKTKLYIEATLSSLPFAKGRVAEGREGSGGGGRSPEGVLVFKNTPQIERICTDNCWKLLNPSAELSNRIEEKISQIEWLGELTKYLPPHQILATKDIQWQNTPFILQFNRAHTGSGTHLITTRLRQNYAGQAPEELLQLQQQFPDRPARVTDYIDGPIFTSNNIVTDSNVLVGNISYQITGLEPFTDQPFATIGNDWGLAQKLLNDEQRAQFSEIVTAIGKKLQHDGWRGLFGIDIVLNEKTGKLYLIEINARQPASTTYESQLQNHVPHNTYHITTFEAHLAALLGVDLKNCQLIPIKDGAQIILRNNVQGTRLIGGQAMSKEQIEKTVVLLKDEGFNVIPYSNTKPGSDLLRIQSTQSIMKGHNQFNEQGEQIKNIITYHVPHITYQKTLSDSSLNVINDYLHLPLPSPIQTPYFNNRTTKIHGALRVLIGKGSVDDIVQETMIIALKEKIDLASLTAEQLTALLVDNHIGIDCSALLYYVLDAELRARNKGSLRKNIAYPYAKNPLRKLLTHLRPVENCNVKTLIHESNSIDVALSDIHAGDMIAFIETGRDHDLNHIILVHHTDAVPLPEGEVGGGGRIHYTHSFQWSTDGKYNHGVRQGTIEIIDTHKPLTEQKWIERGAEGDANETLQHAKIAKELKIKRLKVLA